MIKILSIFTLLIAASVVGNEKRNQTSDLPFLSNADIESVAYAQLKKSAIGEPVKIRVFYKSKSIPPSNNYLVSLLSKDDEILPPDKGGRQIWLIGFDQHLSTMNEGRKYAIDGLIVEDKGFYGALVVYARNINKIANKSQQHNR